MKPAMKRQESYLHTNAMKATSSSLALASSVLGFEIVELWSEDSDIKLHCTYVHASEEMKMRYPDLITGHYPNHKKEHKLSPKLCGLALESPNSCHWRIIESADNQKIDSSITNSKGSIKSEGGYPDISFPIKTEMAYLLDGETGTCRVFIVGLSSEKVEFKESKLKFLSGLAYAIYIAAFDIDEEADVGGEELDVKEFIPSKPITTPFSSTMNLAGMDSQNYSSNPDFSQLNIVNASRTSSISSPAGEIHPISIDVGSWQESNMNNLIISGEKASPNAKQQSDPISVFNHANHNNHDNASSNTHIPTWPPADNFSYPVANIPSQSSLHDFSNINSLSDIKHLADGSNANVFMARYNNEKVIIKMIKEEVQLDQVAVHEFDLEHGMLARMSHPHIIRVLGAGYFPRRFIVLEWLGGGSLNSILMEHQSKVGLAQKLFRKPSFTYANLLSKARDMAEALDYLHRTCHPGATILHRDLKPDNIGFMADGTLKLFDFGLCTCVKSRESSTTAYKMTGYTGSLRYMAPEVALRQPYTEKVDVYSYGIILWQMASDKIPFKGLNKEQFMNHVVREGNRPKLDHSWPEGFGILLTSCWHNDPLKRPSFAAILQELDKLQSAVGTKPGVNRGKSISEKPSSGGAHSSWF
eukprot:gene16052-21797_t